MKIIISNITCQIIHGGKDNLVYYDLKDLRVLLSCKTLNYESTDAYRSGNWDGSYSYLKKDRFPTGFLPIVYNELKDIFDIELIDTRKQIEIPTIVTELGNGWSIAKDWEHQLESVQALVNSKVGNINFYRGIINAATGAGKNSIIVSLLKSFNLPSLILVHRQELLNQFVDFLDDCNLNPRIIGAYTGKKEKFRTNKTVVKKKVHRDFGLGITVAMEKTLGMLLDDYKVIQLLDKIGLYVVDECHIAGTENIMNISRRVGAVVRCFVSGTSLDSENPVSRYNVVGQSGIIVKRITNQELFDKGLTQRPIVNIYKHKSSKTFILNKIKELLDDRVTLIIVKGIAFGNILHNHLSDLPYIVENVTGSDKGRAGKLERLNSGYSNVLIATKMIQEGLNNNKIQRIIYTRGGKSVIATLQTLGRGVRMNEDDSFEWIDFWDTLELYDRHTKERLEIYKKEGFEIFIYE